jgi:parvulin-like peptidyl-prolyl isomerase
MASESFLTIDEQPISMSQVFRYLQANRKLDGFIGDIVRQFVIERELAASAQSQSGTANLNSAVVEQAVIDFRLQNQLTDPNLFQEWLANNGLTYEAFHNQLSTNFRLKKLREDVTEPKLQEHFIDRKVFLDRVVISRIIVQDKELAEELKSQLDEGASFDQLAKDYSITDDRIMNGMVGPVSRGTMPDMLRAAIDLAKPGEIVGPLGLDDRWGLFRVEAFMPASLDDLQLKQTLQDELFEQWLAEKMQNLPIKIQVD